MGVIRHAVATRPVPGFRDNGDAFAVESEGDSWFAAVIDGLGHGTEACEAAQIARRCLCEHWRGGPQLALQQCHRAVQGTRGAVVGAVWADTVSGHLTYVGVGNIEGLITGALGTERLTSLGGFLGGTVMRVRPFEYTFGAGDILIMHSDGISSRFDLAAYPGLLAQDLDFIARVLLREWARALDDATVLVAIHEPAPETEAL